MPVESPVDYIDDLVITNPIGATDPKSQGDDHIRNIKKAIKATFPSITAAVTSSHTELNVLDGATLSVAELNILDGATLDVTELNYLDGATGVTGTGNTVRSASPTFTGTANAAAITASGAIAGASLAASGNASAALVFSGDGAAATPAHSFTADTNTGIYRVGTDTLGFATAGTLFWEVQSDGSLVGRNSAHIAASAGTVGFPAYTFQPDADTGMYSGGANDLRFGTAGTVALEIDNAQNLFILTGRAFTTNGAAATPSWTFNNDGDTGFYLYGGSGSNQIGMSVAGVGEDITSTSGSFTFTATGLTTAPTATGRYVKHGNMVTLFIPALGGTSNATTFTFTGLPAAIQPTRTQQSSQHYVTDNGNPSLIGKFQVTAGSGTLTLLGTNDSATGWTSSNSKSSRNDYTFSYILN